MRILRALLIGVAVCALLVFVGCSLLPAALHMLKPNVTYRVSGTGKTLYLTLDDGPSQATPLILDVLRRHDAHATFFIIADHIRPEIMQRIIAEGHQVANHLKTSASLDKLSDDQFHADFQASDKALSGFSYVKLFRPPGGSISVERAQYVKSQGYEPVVGTIFPLDHWFENKTVIKFLAKALVIDGGILILHDTNARGPRTAAVLDELIPELKAKGYSFSLLPAP